jgi:hypothetical protein
MKILATLIVAALPFASLISCKTNSTGSLTPSEYTASNADFSGFASWSQTVSPRHGFDPSGVLSSGMAHGVNDSTITRTIYVKQPAATVDQSGNYPVGTIFYKNLTMNGMTAMGTGMVKRGGTYNSSGRNWEYFMLGADGKIMARGDTLMGGMCQGCHSSAAAGHDYIFTK